MPTQPTDRDKAGTKLHVAAEAGGIPLTVLLTAANPHDSTCSRRCWTTCQPCARRAAGAGPGRARTQADKAYDHRRCRAYLRQRRITARIARRGVESSTRLGRHHWRIERTITWLFGCRRLRIRYDVWDERHFSFVLLGCSLICCRILTSPPW